MRIKRYIKRKLKTFYLYMYLPIHRINNRNKPLAIVMIDGGLASQMSQYMLGILLKKETGIDVKYDISWFKNYGKDCDNKKNRRFQLLEVFPGLHLDIANEREICLFKKFYLFENKEPYIYNDKIFKKNNQYLGGYYSNWKYLENVKEEIKSLYHFYFESLDKATNDYFEDIKSNENSVAVHIRRGDYINIGVSLTNDYYLDAINYMLSIFNNNGTPHFYFFSDGMSWVKENIISKLPKQVVYTIIDNNDNDSGEKDLFLISQCRHQIISNSGFSFWGAILNNHPIKKVILPSIWTKEVSGFSDGSNHAMCFPDWITIPASFIV